MNDNGNSSVGTQRTTGIINNGPNWRETETGGIIFFFTLSFSVSLHSAGGGWKNGKYF